MKRALRAVMLAAAALLIAAQPSGKPSGDGAVERGKYLVERVAQCPQCHTPRDERGNLIPTQFLQGAPVPVKAPPFPDIRWAFQAPAIAGLPGFSQVEIVRLLSEGIVLRTGQPPTPPMPRFNMTREDAEAIFVYLRSLR